MTWARPSEADRRQQREAEKNRRMAVLLATMPTRRGTYTGTTCPAPKTEPYRDEALLQMARGRPCLLLVPGICNHRTDTTVAAHSNLGIHGKAKGRKADDCYSVWSCFACHYWLDFGRARAEDKEARFTLGHANQVLAWRLVASDDQEKPRDRAAALRALKHLEAR